MTRRVLIAWSCATAVLISAATTSARADINETLYRAIHELCVDFHGTPDAAAQAALATAFQARDMGTDEGPPYAREVGLVSIGTIITFASANRAAPLAECQFVSYSDDLALLLPRMTSGFQLGSPKKRSIDGWLETTGQATVNGRATTFRLQYSLQDNQMAGAFTLNISR